MALGPCACVGLNTGILCPFRLPSAGSCWILQLCIRATNRVIVFLFGQMWGVTFDMVLGCAWGFDSFSLGEIPCFASSDRGIRTLALSTRGGGRQEEYNWNTQRVFIILLGVIQLAGFSWECEPPAAVSSAY